MPEPIRRRETTAASRPTKPTRGHKRGSSRGETTKRRRKLGSHRERSPGPVAHISGLGGQRSAGGFPIAPGSGAGGGAFERRAIAGFHKGGDRGFDIGWHIVARICRLLRHGCDFALFALARWAAGKSANLTRRHWAEFSALSPEPPTD